MWQVSDHPEGYVCARHGYCEYHYILSCILHATGVNEIQGRVNEETTDNTSRADFGHPVNAGAQSNTPRASFTATHGWCKIKQHYLELFHKPRLDLLVYTFIKKLAPTCYRKLALQLVPTCLSSNRRSSKSRSQFTVRVPLALPLLFSQHRLHTPESSLAPAMSLDAPCEPYSRSFALLTFMKLVAAAHSLRH